MTVTVLAAAPFVVVLAGWLWMRRTVARERGCVKVPAWAEEAAARAAAMKKIAAAMGKLQPSALAASQAIRGFTRAFETMTPAAIEAEKKIRETFGGSEPEA